MAKDDLYRRLQNDFAFHRADVQRAILHSEIRDRCRELGELIVNLVPEGREQSTAITKLEESMFWANAGIARKVPDA